MSPNHQPYLLAACAFLAAISAASCSAPAHYFRISSVTPTQLEAHSAGGPATAQPPLSSTTVQTASSLAPVCQASLTCAALNAEQIPMGCVKKIPYTNVLAPKGTTFEVLDKSGDFTCIDSGVLVNGAEVISCHGKQLYAFQLSLHNSACVGAGLATGTGQCQDGYGYDAAQHCCAPATEDGAGSTTVTVNLGACPVPNP